MVHRHSVYDIAMTFNTMWARTAMVALSNSPFWTEVQIGENMCQ